MCNGLTIVGLDLHVLKRVRSLQISEDAAIISADKQACGPARRRSGFNQSELETQMKLLKVQTGSIICNLAHPSWEAHT